MGPTFRRIAFGLVACLAFAGDAVGCSFAMGQEPFQPDVARANLGLDLFQVPAPPAVHVEVTSIDRTAWGACDMFARIELTLSWAGRTSLPLDQVGIYVRPVGPDSPLLTNGDTAYMARIVDGRPTFTIWAHDYPSGGLLDFDADIFVIDSGLRISPPTRFHIQSDQRSTEHYEATLASMSDAGAELRFKLLGQKLMGKPLDVAQARYTMRASSMVTEGLLAHLASGDATIEECGPVTPWCGEHAAALLARGKITLPDYDGNPSEEMLACVGVRQAPGRIARVVLLNDPMWAKIAAAEWVDPEDAIDWDHAATGCEALFDLVVKREAAYLAAHPKARDD